VPLAKISVAEGEAKARRGVGWQVRARAEKRPTTRLVNIWESGTEREDEQAVLIGTHT
jgi:hypothetical protein